MIAQSSPFDQSDRHALARPDRPQRRLGTLALLKRVGRDTLSVFDEELFEELVTVRRYGLVTVAFVSDPAGLRRVLVDRFDDYPRLPAVLRLYRSEIGTGTLANSGAMWRRHRAVALQAMDRRAVASDAAAMSAFAEAEAERLQGDVGRCIDLEAVVGRVAAGLLNLVSSGGDPRVEPILRWLSKVPRKPRPIDLLPLPDWLAPLVCGAGRSSRNAALRAGLQELMSERLAPGYSGRRDVLWRLAHGVSKMSGERLPLHEAGDEAASLLTAGDATVRALTWIWYLLALHPEVEARFHAELDAVPGSGAMSPEHIDRLPYVKRVLDEVLRLYPPIPITPRVARRADVIGGRRIPSGTIVIVSPWVTHRHRRLWAAPETFDPDRFTSERSRERPRLAFMPYLAGPGVCSGRALATLQMLTVVAAFARRFRFGLAPDAIVEPAGGITLQPRGGLWMTPEARGR